MHTCMHMHVSSSSIEYALLEDVVKNTALRYPKVAHMCSGRLQVCIYVCMYMFRQMYASLCVCVDVYMHKSRHSWRTCAHVTTLLAHVCTHVTTLLAHVWCGGLQVCIYLDI
jgi:hypothetical protein